MRPTFPALVAVVGLTLAVALSSHASAPDASVEVLLSDARYDAKAGLTTACIIEFTELLRSRPDLWEAYVGRGSCYLTELDAAAARPDLARAIQIRPDDPALYLELGTIDQLAGDTRTAATDFRLAIEQPTATADQIYEVVEDLRTMKLSKDALLIVDRGLAEYPNFWALHTARARLEASFGNPREADLEFTSGVQLAAGVAKASALEARGRFYLEGKLYRLAISDFTQVIAADPRSWLDFEWRGDAWLGLQQSMRAVDDFSSSLALYRALGTSDLEPIGRILEERGRTYLQLGLKTQAAADFRRALSAFTKPADRTRLKAEMQSATT